MTNAIGKFFVNYRISLLTLAVVLALVLPVFYAITTYQNRVVDFAALLDYDFGPEIQKLQVLDRKNEKALWLGNHVRGAKALGPQDEAILTGRILLPNGYIWSDQAVFRALTPYLATQNKPPASGLDLFPELKTREGLDAFHAMTPRKRLEKYHHGVNRFTGKFYGSFKVDAPHEPGGIRVWPLHASGDYFSKRTDSAAYNVDYNYKKLGWQDGQVLYEDMCKSDGISTRYWAERR